MSALSDKLKDMLWAFKKSRKAQIISAIGLLLLVALVLLYFVLQAMQDRSANGNANNNVNGQDENVGQVTDNAVRRIDGQQVPLAESNLLPISIMIENLVTVRPQSGLGSANLVYEALAEGGITRFMAVYATTATIDTIGPVRSARHYYVDWAEEFGGLYAHVGGSPQALGILGTEDFLHDLNQFGYSEYYYRDENIEAPHNLFTTSELMQFAVRDLELTDTEGSYDPYLFKEDTEKKERPTTVNDIVVDFSSFSYQVEWRYDRDTNGYLRFNAGEPHLDANTESQIVAKNVVVQWVESSLLEEDTGRLDIVTIGEGKALLFQDGAVQEGTWKKTERGERTKFYDANGAEFKFNAGATWIEAVPVDRTVTY